MKAVVIGGAGIQALGAIYDLLDCKEVTELLLADISLEKVRERVNLIGDKRLKAQQVNVLEEDETAEMIKGYDVVVNSGPAPFCPHVTRAALKAGVHYVDLGAWPKETQEQRDLSDRFAEKGITAVLGMGSAPGLSNMMALYGTEQLDQVTDVDIIIAMRDFTEHTSPFVWPYSLDTIMDEYVLNPVVVRNGEIGHLDPLVSEPIQFDHPIGLTYPVFTIHPEPVTLFESFKNLGCLNTSFRIALPEEFHKQVEFLVKLGFGSTELIDMGGAKVSPRQALLSVVSKLPQEKVERKQYSVTRVTVTGRKNERKKKVEVEMYVGTAKRWNLPAGALKTSIPLSIVAQMLGKGQVDKKGVYPPELCVPTDLFFKELAARGMEVFSKEVVYSF